MPRRPSPWWKASHRAWYVKIGGRQVRLAETEREAWREFHKLMSGRESPRPGLSVIEALDLWIGSLSSTLRPRTRRNYERIAQSLANSAGTLPAEELRPLHLSRWVGSHRWGETTRSTMIRGIRIAWKWCKAEGWISSNPLAEVRVREIRRRPPADSGDLRRILAVIEPPGARDLFEFLLETGARPGEGLTLDRSAIDLPSGTARVVGKRGERVVVLSPRAIELLRPLLPGCGRIFRGSRGNPLSLSTFQNCIIKARRKAGVKAGCAQHCRGDFASRLVAAGVDSSIVARLLGHRDLESLTILNRHYLDLDIETLRSAVSRVKADDRFSG